MASWYVAHTKANCERSARDRLVGDGFSVYFPQVREERRYAKSLQVVTRPLFPSYIFVAADERGSRPIRMTTGIAGVIRNPEPILVRQDVIDSMQRREVRGFVVLDDEPVFGYFHAGQRVSIIGGCYRGFDGVFRTRVGSDRAAIMVRLFSRECRAEIRLEDIERT